MMRVADTLAAVAYTLVAFVVAVFLTARVLLVDCAREIRRIWT